MRVVVSGGGTGGHIFPALALVEALRAADPSGQALYIGATTGMEREIVPAAGVDFQAVTAQKVRKLLSPGTVGAGISLLRGYREARAHLLRFGAEVVVGTGGYVAGAAVMAGARLGLPTAILAPDFVPGRMNRLLSRWVRRICVVFPETLSAFPPGRTLQTGLPLRASAVAPADLSPAEARCQFRGLAPNRFTLLVIGGSQGALAVNNVVLNAAPALIAAGAQIIHQTGPRNIAEVEASARERGLPLGAGYEPRAFLNAGEVSSAYRAADLLLCRGGISTLSEGMANRLPMLVVPLPTAYADHQSLNAAALERAGAGIHLPQQGLDGRALAARIEGLRAAPDELKRLAAGSAALGRPNAGADIARILVELAAGSGR